MWSTTGAAPTTGPRVGGSIMIGTGSVGIGTGSMVGMGMRFPPPSQYRHEVTLLLRDLGSNQVVYETSARTKAPGTTATTSCARCWPPP